MVLCPSCGAENADGMRFCVKCGGGLGEPAPSAGSWQQPSGNLGGTPYDTPSGNLGGAAPGGGYSPGGYGQPDPYAAPPAVSYGGGGGVGGALTATGVGGRPFALWGDRVLAALIDGALVAVVMIVINIIFGSLIAGAAAIGGNEDNPLAGGICCISMIVVPVSMLVVGLYNKVYLITKRGSSIGQGIMKLKVVDASGNLLQTGSAVLRLLVQMGLAVVPFLGMVLVLLDLLFPLWDPQRQTLHDKAVGSFVVKEG